MNEKNTLKFVVGDNYKLLEWLYYYHYRMNSRTLTLRITFWHLALTAVTLSMYCARILYIWWGNLDLLFHSYDGEFARLPFVTGYIAIGAILTSALERYGDKYFKEHFWLIYFLVFLFFVLPSLYYFLPIATVTFEEFL